MCQTCTLWPKDEYHPENLVKMVKTVNQNSKINNKMSKSQSGKTVKNSRQNYPAVKITKKLISPISQNRQTTKSLTCKTSN